MLPNGLILCLDMALGPDASATRAGRERYAALVLGMFREDIVVVPGTSWSMPSPSLGHFYPRSRRYGAKRFAAAVAAARAGEPGRGTRLLGHAIHVLVDMACPAHAQRVPHSLREPFEICIEAHADELARLPLPDVPVPDQGRAATGEGAGDIIESLATAARREEVDRTNTPWGRFFRRIGRRRPLVGTVIHEQARRLIPLAAGHVRALIAHYDEATVQVKVG